MPRPLVVLIDVPEPYRGAFLERGVGQGFAFETATHSISDPRAASLAVLGASDPAEAVPERISAIRKSLVGHAPIVLLAGGFATDAVEDLTHCGVSDVIALPAPAAEVVARALLCASSFGEELIGQSAVMQRLRTEIAAIAPLQSTVLLTGETGVGKGLVARLIHRSSGHSDRPFVHVDCSSLAPSIIESELFGHERGAFTGAALSRSGRFETAKDGAIFLDEIGELDPHLQVKLLRVLQDRQFERLGSATPRAMKARVIAATNRDLRSAVSEGRFRSDLFFRLSVLEIWIPPLRERHSDIPALVRRGIDQIAERLQLKPPVLDACWQERMSSYSWPGNVRELMNVLERMLVNRQAGLDDEYALDRLLSEHPSASAAPWIDVTLEETERIAAMLQSSGGNVARTARRLGLPRSTLRYKIRTNGLAHLIPKD